MRRGLLPRRLPAVLVDIALLRPKATLAVLAALVVLALFAASRGRIETDLLALVPADNQVVDDFVTTIERFGSVDLLLLIIRLEPGLADDSDPEPAYELAELWAEALGESPLIDWVEYRAEDPIEAFEPLLDSLVLFLPPEELETLITELEEDSRGFMARRATTLRRELLSPQGLAMARLAQIDPFGLVPRALGGTVRGLGARFDEDSGYLIDSDGGLLLMLVKPTRPAQDVEFNRRLIVELEILESKVLESWQSLYPGRSPLVTDKTGTYLVTLEDTKLIVGDVIVGASTSMVGVLVLFLFSFRRRAALIYAALPLLAGLALTFGFAALVFGRLSSVTSAFAALLIGLGIDFIIVLYARYVEERRRGVDHEAAIRIMGRHTGVGVLLGAVTTAATFGAFSITQFRGLAELGAITGVGILLVAGTVFLGLPALLSTFGAKRPPQRLHLTGFGLDRLALFSWRRPRLVLVTLSISTSLAFVVALGVEFEDDVRNMRSPDNRAVQLREEAMQAFELRFTPMMMRFDAPTALEAIDAARPALDELASLVASGDLARVESVVDRVPSLARQRRNLEILRAADLDEGILRADFAVAMRAEGLAPEGFAAGFEHFLNGIGGNREIELSGIGGSLGRALERYVVEGDWGASTVVYLYPAPGRFERIAPESLVALAARHGGRLAGTNVVSAELRRLVWEDAWVAAMLGLVAVLVLLALDLGGLKRALLSLLPLLAGLVWMVALMRIAGISINFMNIFVLTMIIGIGVDYGVHLLHRHQESGGDPRALAQTCKAIGVAAATTMVGFGSLALSHYPGLRSVGYAALLGASATALLSVMVLPALLSLTALRVVREKQDI